MTTNQRRVVAFVSTLAFSGVTAWLGGYNFDTRSPDVAFGFAFCVFISLVVAACPYLENTDGR